MEQAGHRPSRVVSISLAIIAGLMVLYFLQAAAVVLIPLVVAVLVYLLVSPLCDLGARFRIPRALSTCAIFGLLLAVIAGGSYGLAEPAASWIDRAPQSFAEITYKLRSLVQALSEFERAARTLKSITTPSDPSADEVVVRENGLPTDMVADTGRLLASAVVILVLTTFLLATGGQVGRELVRMLPQFGDRRRALRITGVVKQEISHYLLTVTAINVGLGIAIALVCWLASLPNPALWGALGGLSNYIPYLGPTVTLITVFLVGLLTFDQIAPTLVAPALIVALNVIESQFVTPALVARRLSLSPVVVFLSIVVWAWLWGIAGALLAVPLVAAMKITCDHVPSLTQLGRVLGPRRARRPHLQ